MASEVIIAHVEAASAAFSQHHQVDVPQDGARLRLGDDVGHGAFGTVYPVESIDGRPPSQQILAKVFGTTQMAGGGGPASTIAKTHDLHLALESSGVPAWPDAILGLPYCLFRGSVQGKPTLVALMLDLRARGYTPAPFTEQDELKNYNRRPQQDRIDIAVRLCERLRLLEDIGFVHGDLNSDNLLFNLRDRDVQVIDFDSGVVLKTGNERPDTAGKTDDCMPPEVKGAGTGQQVYLDVFTPEAERWSTGSLIGYCLLGFHPGFFLRAISKTVVDGYARAHETWPEIHVDGPLFTKLRDNQRHYGALRDRCLQLPRQVRERFAEFFNAGIDGSRRPTAAQWRDTLTILTRPPEIDRFTISEPTVFQGMVVELAWATTGSQHIDSWVSGSSRRLERRW